MLPLNKPPNKPHNLSKSKNLGCTRPLFFFFLLSFGLLLLLLPSLPLMFAQNTLVGEETIVVELALVPLLDNYGYPAINADGTFYPNDQFELTYHTKAPQHFIFERAVFIYDFAAFKLLNSGNDNFTSPISSGTFEVLPSAVAGTYPFDVEIWGQESETQTNSSSLITKTTLLIQVVQYDPHFTSLLTYTIPSGDRNGDSSFDRPFAIIVRYDGNGPTHNLAQRAIIDDYHWEGYAQKIPQINTLHQQLTPNLTVANFFNQTSNTHFTAPGIDNKTSTSPLMVDNTNIQATHLPQTFNWQTNTTHTYTWTPNLPITTTTNQPPNSATKTQTDEWFEWQLCFIFPPSTNQIDPLQTNQTQNPTDLINPLIQQFNSPNGTLTTTPIGNTITAIYAHNKPIEKFSQEQNINKNQTLHCTTQLPLYFTANQRYAKIQYSLNPQIAKAITTQNFTDTLHYNITTGSTRFGTPNYFTTNFTAQYEFYDKLFNATAYRWNPTHQTWNSDPTVNITARFESAFNFTTTDILLLELEEQTTDQTALKLAQIDLYDSGIQTFSGTGTLTTNLKHTSPLYYNLYIEAKQKQTVTLQRTIQLNFRDNQPYTLPLNFDPASPLTISIIADDTQTIRLAIDAPTELGGLTNLSIYYITKTLPEKNISQLSKDQLNLKLQKTLNLTQPHQQVPPPQNYDVQTAQFYQYYEGYSSVFSDALGFCGQTQLALSKDPTLTALTDQGEALIYVEATNVWGTTFHQIIAVQPYTAPKWVLPLNQATIYLAIIVIFAIITNFVIYLIRAKQ